MVMQLYAKTTLFLAAACLTLAALALAAAQTFPVREQLIFVSDRDSINPNIYLLDSAHGFVIRLTTGPLQAGFTPAFSPDGRTIVFSSGHSGGSDLYFMDYTGGSVRRVVTDTGIVFAPAWSPDGRYIAFVLIADLISDPDNLFLYDLSTSSVQQVTRRSTMEMSPAWSPDGRMLAFASAHGNISHLYLLDMAAAAQNDCLPTCPLIQITESDYWHNHPAFSPDGNWLAYETRRGESSEIVLLELSCLERMERGEGCAAHTHTLVRINGIGGYPAWSPDGAWIAFYMPDGIPSRYQLYAVEFACYQQPETCPTRTRRLLESQFNAWSPVWWP